MTAFFGIKERDAQGFLDRSVVCYPRSPDGQSDLHSIVFIKHCTPQSSMHIKAVGVVRSDYPTESDPDIHTGIQSEACLYPDYLNIGSQNKPLQVFHVPLVSL